MASETCQKHPAASCATHEAGPGRSRWCAPCLRAALETAERERDEARDVAIDCVALRGMPDEWWDAGVCPQCACPQWLDDALRDMDDRKGPTMASDTDHEDADEYATEHGYPEREPIEDMGRTANLARCYLAARAALETAEQEKDEALAIGDWTEAALEGREVSDFAESFQAVSGAMYLRAALETAERDTEARTVDLAQRVLGWDAAVRLKDAIEHGDHRKGADLWECSCDGRNEGLYGNKGHPPTRDRCPVCGDHRKGADDGA